MTGWGTMRSQNMTDEMMNPASETVRWAAWRLIGLKFPVCHVEDREIVMDYSTPGARWNGAQRLRKRGYAVVHEYRTEVGIVIFGDEPELKLMENT